jgi:hypothetical protein
MDSDFAACAIRKRIVIVASFIAAIGTSGCVATVPAAPKALDVSAKQFTVPAGQSVVYIARDDLVTGSINLFQIALDGRMLGGLAPSTYFAETVPPGDHTVVALGSENQVSLKVSTSPGSAYYVKVEPHRGLAAPRVRLVITNYVDGQRVVKDGVMAEGLK